MFLKIIASLCFVLIGLILYKYNRLKYIQSKQKKSFLKIFENNGDSMPTLEFGSSYGWPTFKVTFKTQNDLSLAEKHGLTEEFKNYIQSYYDSEFDPNRAVYFTSLQNDR